METATCKHCHKPLFMDTDPGSSGLWYCARNRGYHCFTDDKHHWDHHKAARTGWLDHGDSEVESILCDPDDNRRLALLVAAALPTLSWRVHGIGLLQAYLVEGDPEIRVHVWDETMLQKPGIEDSGAVHDHRFTLDSTILSGSIHHTTYHLTPAADGGWQKWTVPHARKFLADRTSERAGDFTAVDGRHQAKLESTTLHAGTRYTFAKGLYHRATAAPGTVTIITKRNQDASEAPAKILAPVGTIPEHAFKWQVPPDHIIHIVDRAQTRLRREYK
jgi:hypothetical protein